MTDPGLSGGRASRLRYNDRMPSRLSAAFFIRDYRILWAILMLGSIAFWMRILGTAQWLLETTESAYMVGLIGVVQLVVQLPMTLWAGTLADRVDRKWLLSLAYSLTGFVLLALGILNSIGLLTPVWVYLGIAVTAGSHMLASPARGALLAARRARGSGRDHPAARARPRDRPPRG